MIPSPDFLSPDYRNNKVRIFVEDKFSNIIAEYTLDNMPDSI